jgi:predicted dithiol-disulfide oxidoreductase (DUF899 family)
MLSPEIVDRSQWLAAHEALMAKEKAMTRAQDALAAERRRQPWELVEKDYVFEGPGGRLALPDLFEGRRQLILYHHMLKPDDPAPCAGCSLFTDNIGNLVHLNQRDTTYAMIGRAPFDQIEALKKRLGWTLPFYSTSGDLNRDFFNNGDFGLNVFFRQDGKVYRTYYSTDRGLEKLGTIWSLLDITPLGRQETWEDSPEGVARTEPFRWWRLNDEYETPKTAHGCCGG